MQRRNFLRTGSLAGLATLVSASHLPADLGSGDHRTIPDDSFELNEMSVEMLQDKMKKGEYTSRSITALYLDRIRKIDKDGPKLNAVIELNPEALSIAEAMDRERAAGKVRGPMHGIPVLIKDNIDTADRMMTTAGALALHGNVARDDAFIIKKLRQSGAVLLGKTNLSEWANFRSTHSASGWSSRGGQTRCPYMTDRNPSGSSAGSGSAAAANLCAVAIGTETDGSIVSPSSVNGLVGLKPTVGLWSRSGIIPISKTQDTAGPMARSVRDAAILLAACAGEDERDRATRSARGKIKKDYLPFLQAAGLHGKRIGVEKGGLKSSGGTGALFHEAIELMKTQGATIVEVNIFDQIKQAGKDEFTVLLYEFKDGVNAYLNHASCNMKSLADVIAFNRKNAEKAMPFFQQETLELAEKKGDLSSKAYLDAVRNTTGISRRVISSLMKAHGLNAIAAQTNGPACCIDLVNGDYDNGYSFSGPAAMAGYPHITVPMGMVHGLPVGLSFISTPYDEAGILALAYAYEQASQKRVPPKFANEIYA